ncbi:MAG: tRNA pseudouridine(38-40) synthase TruA [Candidatus Geothermincolia bacterium]
MARYSLTLEYAGATFHGFQRQPGLSTIQGELESAVRRITGEDALVMGAGRTDAGVHAIGQVAAIDLDREVDVPRLLTGLNAVLPGGIAVTGMSEARADFDPRRDAVWREYRYFILNRSAPSPVLRDFTCHVPTPLDLSAMGRACGLVVGEHDFSAFRVKGDSAESAVRNVLECELTRPAGHMLCLRVRANAFLYRMVRILAGAVTAAGSGRMDVDELRGHLEGGTSPCADPLPAEGLFLWRVEYPPGVKR